MSENQNIKHLVQSGGISSKDYSSYLSRSKYVTRKGLKMVRQKMLANTKKITLVLIWKG